MVKEEERGEKEESAELVQRLNVVDGERYRKLVVDETSFLYTSQSCLHHS